MAPIPLARPGALILTLLLVACGPSTSGSPLPTPRPAPQERRPPVLTPAPGLDVGDPRTGQRLLVEKGCGGCHTLAGVPAASGVASAGYGPGFHAVSRTSA